MKWQVIIPLFFLAVSLSACYPAPQDVDAEVVEQEINETTNTFIDAFNKGDNEIIGGLYTTDAMLMPPDTGIIEGRDAIEKFWQQIFAMGADSISLENMDVAPHLLEAWVTGSGVIYNTEGDKLDEIKYIIGWQRVGEDWKIHRDIWNSSMPAPESPMEEPGMEASAEQETM